MVVSVDMLEEQKVKGREPPISSTFLNAKLSTAIDSLLLHRKF